MNSKKSKEFLNRLRSDLHKMVRAREHPLGKHKWETVKTNGYFQIDFFPPHYDGQFNLSYLHFEIMLYPLNATEFTGLSIEIHPERSQSFKELLKPFFAEIKPNDPFEISEWNEGATGRKKGYEAIRLKYENWVNPDKPYDEVRKLLLDYLTSIYDQYFLSLFSYVSNPLFEKKFNELESSIVEKVKSKGDFDPNDFQTTDFDTGIGKGAKESNINYWWLVMAEGTLGENAFARDEPIICELPVMEDGDMSVREVRSRLGVGDKMIGYLPEEEIAKYVVTVVSIASGSHPFIVEFKFQIDGILDYPIRLEDISQNQILHNIGILGLKGNVIGISKSDYEEIIRMSHVLAGEVPQFESFLEFNGDIKAKDAVQSFGLTYTSLRLKQGQSVEPVLGAREIALELASVIQELEMDSGMMVGIFGKWGRGKTFLFEQVWKALEPSEEFIKVDFHAWKYQDTESAWAYLYEVLAEHYYKQPKYRLYRFWRVLSLNFKRNGSWLLFSFFGLLLLGLLVYFFESFLEVFGEGSHSGGWWTKTIAVFATFSTLSLGFIKLIQEQIPRFTSVASRYGKRHSFDHLLGTQAEVQKEIRTLLNHWIGKKNERVLLFVDDLDRCKEDRIIPMIDSLRVMLDDEAISQRVVVVAAVDERLLRNAIEQKYINVVDDTLKKQLPREYMDKLFIMGIKLGELTGEERLAVFETFSKNDVQTDGIKKSVDSLTGDLTQSTESNESPQEYAEDFTTDDDSHEIEGQNQFGSDTAESERTAITKEVDPVEQKIISSSENEELQKAIKELHGLTPRQIRIFYYRYLLGKKLLQVLSDEIILKNGYSTHFMMECLKQITITNNSASEFFTVTNSGEDLNVSTNFRGVWPSMSREQQNVVSQVIEMIVAY